MSSMSYRITLLIPQYVFNKNYPIDPITFGEKLRRKRIDSGLQIKELANIIGVTDDTIINWEKRDVSPASNNLKKIKKWSDAISIYEMKK
jgi:DNA-binding XRE family transcriptional regulator